MEYIYIYLIGLFIYAIALIDEYYFEEILACFILGVIWPIHLPAMILKSYINKRGE